MLQRALAIQEEQLEAMHPDTATSLQNLAALYYQQEKYSQAEPLMQRALSILEQTLGHKHSTTQRIRANHAALLKEMGQG